MPDGLFITQKCQVVWFEIILNNASNIRFFGKMRSLIIKIEFYLKCRHDQASLSQISLACTFPVFALGIDFVQNLQLPGLLIGYDSQS